MAVVWDASQLDPEEPGLRQLRADLFQVQPPRGRRARLPELLVGAALMVGFALAAVLWHLSTKESEPALALRVPVERGHVIKAADLRVVYLSTSDQVARLSESRAGDIVGRMALSDLPAGALLTAGSVSPVVAVGAGEGLVGLNLEPGQVPSRDLVPGDVVNVIAGPAEGAVSAQADGRVTNLLASRAVLFAAEDVGTQGRTFVSVKLPEADANRVAAAAERGPVRLVLVGR